MHIDPLVMLQAVQQDFPQASKIELVAKALRTALLAAPHGQGRFLRPILASFAVLGDLEGALSIIKQVKEEQLAADGTSFLLLCHHLVCCSWASLSIRQFSGVFAEPKIAAQAEGSSWSASKLHSAYAAITAGGQFITWQLVSKSSNDHTSSQIAVF